MFLERGFIGFCGVRQPKMQAHDLTEDLVDFARKSAARQRCGFPSLLTCLRLPVSFDMVLFDLRLLWRLFPLIVWPQLGVKLFVHSLNHLDTTLCACPVPKILNNSAADRAAVFVERIPGNKKRPLLERRSDFPDLLIEIPDFG